MNLFYISPRDMRKNRADPVHTMYTCKAFTDLGWNVTLVTPRVIRRGWQVRKSDIWGLYNNMKPVFKITELPTYIDDVKERIYVERAIKFICFLGYYLSRLRTLNSCSVIYAHCYISILPAILLKKAGLLKSRIYYEKAEYFPDKSTHNYILNNVDGIVAINEYIKEKSLETYNVGANDIIKLPFTSQADDYMKITSTHDLDSVRHMLDLDKHKTYITYSGKLSESSLEVRYILDSARKFKRDDIVFLFVGGTPEAVAALEDYCKSINITNTKFVGYQTLTNLYYYVHASDILVSYYDTRHETHIHQRVPAKLSVYLSANKPLVLADLPCLREWWTDEQVFFVEPDKPELLADVLRYILANPEEACRKADNARKFALGNTYSQAYKTVSSFLLKNSPVLMQE